MLIVPESLVDKDGSPVLMGRLRHNDMTDGRSVQDVCRMIIYCVDRLLERTEAGDGITIFHDMEDLSRKNIDIGIPKILFGALLGHFPLRIKQIYILNAPWFFYPIFTSLSTIFFSPKLRKRIHFIKSLDEVLQAIDQEKLLVEHGGKLEFDASAWVQQQIDRELNDQSMSSLQNCLGT